MAMWAAGVKVFKEVELLEEVRFGHGTHEEGFGSDFRCSSGGPTSFS